MVVEEHIVYGALKDICENVVNTRNNEITTFPCIVFVEEANNIVGTDLDFNYDTTSVRFKIDYYTKDSSNFIDKVIEIDNAMKGIGYLRTQCATVLDPQDDVLHKTFKYQKYI